MQEILGLVLEPQHPHRCPDIDIGQRHPRQALAGDERVTVGTGGGIADRGVTSLAAEGIDASVGDVLEAFVRRAGAAFGSVVFRCR